MEVKEIIELMKAMSENGMTGFELAEGDWKLTMKREKRIVRCKGISCSRTSTYPIWSREK